MITITETQLEETLKALLQRNVTFVINNKQWRSGRMLLFKQMGFYIEFVLENDKEKNERFEIPIPFDVIHEKDKAIFSYTLKSLICNRPDITNEISERGDSTKSKYFNNTLEIRINDTGRKIQ